MVTCSDQHHFNLGSYPHLFDRYRASWSLWQCSLYCSLTDPQKSTAYCLCIVSNPNVITEGLRDCMHLMYFRPSFLNLWDYRFTKEATLFCCTYESHWIGYIVLARWNYSFTTPDRGFRWRSLLSGLMTMIRLIFSLIAWRISLSCWIIVDSWIFMMLKLVETFSIYFDSFKFLW